MNIFRKRFWLVGITGVLFLMTAAPIIIIHFYQDKIRDYIVAELGRQFKGRIELAGFKVAPFANFPYISVDLQGLQFFGSAADTVPIYRFQDLYVGFDVAYLMRGKLNIKQLRAEEGELNIVIAEDGSINLLKAKKSKEEQETADSTDNTLSLDLKKVRLSEIRLKVDDRESNKFTNLTIGDATGSFRYVEQIVDFRADAIAELTEYTNGKTTLFRNKYFEIHNDLSYDLTRDFLDIRPGKLALKSGELNFGGTIDFANDMDLNLQFDGRKDNFDLFVSLAPEAVVAAMEQFSTRGDIYLKASITGKSLHTAPHIDVEMGCANTFFARKDTKRDVIRDLAFKGFFNTGKDNTLQTSVFYLESLYGAPENSFIKGTLRVENFENPLINMDFHADIDLRYLPDFIPTGALQRSSGKVKMDITLQEYVTPDNVLEVASQLQDGTASRIAFENVSLKLKDYPNAIESINGNITLEGDHLKTKQLRAKIGDSDMEFSLDLDNLLHFLHGDDVPVAFSLKADARKLVPGQLVPLDKRPALDSVFAAVWRDEIYDFHAELDIRTTSRTLDTFHYLPTLAVDFHDFRFRSKLYPNEIKEIRGVFDINDQHIRLKDFIFHAGESRMYATAEVAPVAPLRVPSRKEWVNFTADVQSPYFDVKKLVSYDGKCLLNDQIEREEIHKLDFKGSGRFWANVFKETGFVSELNIDRLLFRINELPKVERVSGKITTDTLGSIQIKNFTASVGKTDIRTTLNLLHFLDNDLKNKQIKGSFEANLIDTDELTGYKEAATRSSSANTAAAATPAKNKYEDSLNIFAFEFPTMSLDVKISKFIHHKYLIQNIKGRVRTTPQGYAYLDSMRFDAADGQLMVHGYFNGSNAKDVYLTGDLRMDRINLNKLLYKFDNFGQEYLVSENLRGILSGTVNTTARMHPDFTVDVSKTRARAELTVQNGRLLRFAPLRAMATFMGERNLEDIAFGELTNTLEIKDGNVHIPAMKLASTIGYMYISGKQNFDDQLQMDYEIRLPLSLVKEASWNFMKSRLFGRGRRAAAAANDSEATAANVDEIPSDEELVEEEREIIDSQRGLIRRYINVRVAGTTSDFKINLGRRRR
ncbi:hypothetical protein [Rhodoflexus sp.]